MRGAEAQKFRLTLESVREDIVAAVHGWRAKGQSDDDMVLLVDALHPGKPKLLAETRAQLELTIPAFEPSIAIELAKRVPGQVPAVVDVHDYVRQIIWVDLTPPFTW